MRISSIHRFLAALIAIVYMAGVFGFDVHCSEEAHRTYVVPLFAGIACDHIHPDHPCHHHDEDECADHEDCCHDSVEVLDVTGSAHSAVVAVPQCFALLPGFTATAPSGLFLHFSFVRPAVFLPPPPELSMMCVLRV